MEGGCEHPNATHSERWSGTPGCLALHSGERSSLEPAAVSQLGAATRRVEFVLGAAQISRQAICAFCMLRQQLLSSRSSKRTEPGGQELLRHECGPNPSVSAGVLGSTLGSTIHAVDGQNPLRTKSSALNCAFCPSASCSLSNIKLSSIGVQQVVVES